MTHSLRRRDSLGFGVGFAIAVLSAVVAVGAIIRSLWIHPL